MRALGSTCAMALTCLLAHLVLQIVASGTLGPAFAETRVDKLPAGKPASIPTPVPKPSPGTRTSSNQLSVTSLSTPKPKVLSSPRTVAVPTFASRFRYQTHFSLEGGLGFSSLSLGGTAADDPADPNRVTTPTSLMQWSAAATVAYLSPVIPSYDLRCLVGLEPNYEFVGQRSTLDPDLGSFRGSRFSWLAPVVGAIWSRALILKLRADISGNYVLANPTAEGSTLSYTSPIGGQLTVLYPLRAFLPIRGLHAGLQVQYLSFSRREIAGVSSEQLTKRLTWTRLGLTVAYVF